ncbi:MAG: signal peptidase II [Thermoguttaceae bacterium]|nr:signal peptidase II [Thermoguttaceae bacterium]
MNKLSSRSSRLLLFFAIAALFCALDLGTKHWIFERLGRPGESDVWWLIPDVFGLQTSLNQGALFGIGQGQIPLFVTLSCVAFVGIVGWVWADSTRSVFLASTLGLITAGILGNLWDRVGLHRMRWSDFDADVWGCPSEMVGEPIYAVRDWILVMLGDYPWPNFNIADSCLVCGAILIGLYALFTPTPKPAVAANETAAMEDKAEN